MRFFKDGNALIGRQETETLRIEPWGTNAFRVRATRRASFSGNDRALTEPVSREADEIEILETENGTEARIRNGKITAVLTRVGIITFYRGEKKLLREYYSNYDGSITRESECFCPVLRMHGDRGPYDIPPLDNRDFGGGYLHTGHSNELWSYGEEIYEILKHYLDIRISMQDYIYEVMKEAHENGSPAMRTMFYEFPEDPVCWELEDQYMFGPDYLVAPVMEQGMKERSVYLPAGKWQDIHTGRSYEGGQRVTAAAPLEIMPVFRRLS